jgi:hypothetical protein
LATFFTSAAIGLQFIGQQGIWESGIGGRYNGKAAHGLHPSAIFKFSQIEYPNLTSSTQTKLT